uniref:DUF4773 domain-containing protein n=1 Tax=Strongyloides papillosus TaxID=174720 RepID=A0A0N5CAU0_STREA
MNEEYGIDNMRSNKQEMSYLTGCLPQRKYLFQFINMLIGWFQSFASEVLKERLKTDEQSKVYRTSERVRSLFGSKLLIYKNDPFELEKLKVSLTCCSTIDYGKSRTICNSSDGCDGCHKGHEKNSKVTYGDFIGGRKCGKIKENCTVKLDIWCLDPSLCFADVFHNVHSNILASGTLFPINTFISELGMKFEPIVRGDQIIPKEQIFASVIDVGPRNKDIICTRNEILSG